MINVQGVFEFVRSLRQHDHQRRDLPARREPRLTEEDPRPRGTNGQEVRLSL